MMMIPTEENSKVVLVVEGRGQMSLIGVTAHSIFASKADDFSSYRFQYTDYPPKLTTRTLPAQYKILKYLAYRSPVGGALTSYNLPR